MPYPPIEDDPRLTAFALGEIEEDAERAEVEARLAEDPEAAAFVEDVRRMAKILSDELRKEHTAPPALDPARREAVEREMAAPAHREPRAYPFPMPRARHYAIAAAALVAVGGVGVILMQQAGKHRPLMDVAQNHRSDLERSAPPAMAPAPVAIDATGLADDPGNRPYYYDAPAPPSAVAMPAPAPMPEVATQPGVYNLDTRAGNSPAAPDAYAVTRNSGGYGGYGGIQGQAPMGSVPGQTAGRSGMGGGMGGMVGMGGMAGGSAAGPPAKREAEVLGRMRRDQDLKSAAPSRAPGMEPAPNERFMTRGLAAKPAAPAAPPRPEPAPESALGEVKSRAPAEPGGAALEGMDRGGDTLEKLSLLKAKKSGEDKLDAAALGVEAKQVEAGVKLRERMLQQGEARQFNEQEQQDFDREAFAAIVENPFILAAQQPLSTFGVDVDTASYANVRRFLINENRMPPPDAVRIEEMVNYFRYDYAPPQDDRPFSVNVEFARCPWQPDHRLLRVGLKGKEVSIANRPPSNLVFLIDVSGSMREYNKLPWVKESLRMLVSKLGENDRVSIVVYAGTKGLALPSTTGDRKDVILAAIERLEAGGSTNGGEGLRLAYDLAQQEFVQGGINRIILCTDGDFNTGDVTDIGAVTRLAEEKRATKVKLTVLGFGQGNLQDDKLEALANKGDGQYAYIDTLKEAHRVLVEQMSGTLQTIAKDVKLQLDFNPRFVGAYRLLGYENRILQAQDFRDDTKDAGDIGAGHTVTALYELIPPGGEGAVPAAEPSRFQEPAKPRDDDLSKAATLVVNLRYKQPDGDVSTGFDLPAKDPGGDYANASTDFKFAASVAEFGLLLRQSKFRGQATYEAALELAQASQGDDPSGDRKEFLDLIRRARDSLQRPK
ncbi:MAG: von Willebrand factor type A domain-containing protein [Isosphaeraceae bacterium]